MRAGVMAEPEKHNADSWFTPGRPTHSDFLALADLVLAGDAASSEGNFEGYVAEHSTVPLKELTDIALHEADTLMSSQGVAAFGALMEASWATGLAAGIRVSRNAPPPVMADMERDPAGTAYAGVDPVSVRYVARQRCMRILKGPAPTPTRKKMLLAGAWLDAVIVGLRFDEHKSSLSRESDDAG